MSLSHVTLDLVSLSLCLALASLSAREQAPTTPQRIQGG